MTNELKDDERVKAGVARLLAQRNTYANLLKQRDHEATIAEALRILDAKKGREAAIKWVSETASIGDIKRLVKPPVSHKPSRPKTGDYAGMRTDLMDYSTPTARAEIARLFVGDENSKPSVDAFCDAFYDAVTEIYKLIPEDGQ